jgi:CBF/Mak21 family
MLEHEVGGSASAVVAGGFSADVKDPSEAGALTASLWELSLLMRHYHPHVAAAAKAIAVIPPQCEGRCLLTRCHVDAEPPFHTFGL